MRKWLVLSTLLHLAVFLLVWLGLPRLPQQLPEPTQIIPVDIADLSEITAAKKPPEPPKPKPEPPKPEPPKPPPPAPPPPSEAKPPEPKPAEQKPQEEKAEPLPAAKPKPPKPEPPKQDNFSSILKNVSKMKPQEKTEEQKPAPQKELNVAPSAPQVPATAEHLTASEADALRQQLRGCWNPPVGARDADKMSVDIYLSINQDRTIKEAVVVDQARMSSDPFFRAMAESALRALYNPHCSPLALPPEKYQEWRDTILTFNPRDMF